MKTYNDGMETLKVVRCPAGLYIVKGLPFMQNATASKVVAQNFLESWATKHKLRAGYDLDADMYDECNESVCRMCIAWNRENKKCERL